MSSSEKWEPKVGDVVRTKSRCRDSYTLGTKPGWEFDLTGYPDDAGGTTRAGLLSAFELVSRPGVPSRDYRWAIRREDGSWLGPAVLLDGVMNYTVADSVKDRVFWRHRSVAAAFVREKNKTLGKGARVLVKVPRGVR